MPRVWAVLPLVAHSVFTQLSATLANAISLHAPFHLTVTNIKRIILGKKYTSKVLSVVEPYRK